MRISPRHERPALDRQKYHQCLWWALGLNFAFMLVELLGGLITGSMALLSDALGSIGAMAAGGVILLTGWTPVDTVVSVLIAILILRGGWRLLMKAIDILMESTPPEIDYHQVLEALKSREHIVDLHDLHIWSISSGVLALSAHIQLSDECVKSGHWPRCLRETQNFLREQWGIEHTTLQTEPLFFQERYG